MTRFGDFSVLCHQTPSYPWCNLFYRQLSDRAPTLLTGVSQDAQSAPVGVNPECGIPRAGFDGSIANIANILACSASMIFIGLLIFWTSRRKAAVGRVEIRVFFSLYLVTLPLQLITTGSFLEQGSTALVVITAIHAGAVVAFFWALLANALVATQVVEDGTLSSLIPYYFFCGCFFAATTYISLDVGLGFTTTLGSSTPPESLHSIPLFVLTSIWPPAAAILYLALMAYIVLGILNEVRPMWYYVLSAALFILSQLDYFLLNKLICRGTSHEVDGSFIATLLETAAVGVIFLAWKNITEEAWNENPDYPSYPS